MLRLLLINPEENTLTPKKLTLNPAKLKSLTESETSIIKGGGGTNTCTQTVCPKSN